MSTLFAIAVSLSVCLVAGAYAGVLPGQASGTQIIMGDVDCGGSVNPNDSLKILRSDAGLSYDKVSGCPPIGASIDAGPTPTPVSQAGLTRNNPVPRGSSLVTPEGWRIEVLDFDPDATQIVLDENQFNDPPKPGFRYAIVRIRMTNVSAGSPGDPDPGFALRMVGSRNVGYSTFEESCGVIPDDADFKSDDIFPGGALEGNVCYQIGQTENNFTIYTDFLFSDEEDSRWFEVD